MHELWINQLISNGNACQVDEKKGRDYGADSAKNRREFSLLVVGKCDRVSIQVKPLNAPLGVRTRPGLAHFLVFVAMGVAMGVNYWFSSEVTSC